MMADNNSEQCFKNKVCSKLKGHPAKCDRKRACNPFWKSSPIQNVQSLKSDINNLEHKRPRIDETMPGTITEIKNVEGRRNALVNENNRLGQENEALTGKLETLNNTFEKVKLLIERKNYGKTKREKTPTTWESINDSSNSTTYSRQNETRNVLEYIHGGINGAIFGAWDSVCRYASNEIIEKFMLSHKHGKFVEELYGKFSSTFNKTKQTMEQAVAKKSAVFLSRRKFNFLCKVQSSTFNIDDNKWCDKTISYGDQKINLHEKSISDYAVSQFVQSLQIGDIHDIPGFCGVTRTVTALVTMIIDLHLTVPNLYEKLPGLMTWNIISFLSSQMMVHQNQKIPL